MKKISFSMLAMAGMLLAACTENDVIAEGGGTLPEGYMSVNIKLPTAPSTRAANDVFDDGEDNEYNVEDCALLLFEGDSESEATLIGAQAITLPGKESGEKDENITNTYSYNAIAIVKGRTSSSKNLYAMALLNYKNVMPTTSSTDGMPTFNTTGNSTVSKSTKLADIRKLITTANLISNTDATNNYFFMTNAVLSTDQGGKTSAAPSKNNVFQLVELDPSKIYESEAEAKNNPAGEILVERAVAKATMKVGNNFNYAIGNTTLTISKIEWAIDNMEPQTFITRNPGDSNKEDYLNYISYINAASDNYRFVGGASTKDGGSLTTKENYYRTYWCIDPNYDKDAPVKGDADVTSDYMLTYDKNPFLTGSDKYVTIYPNSNNAEQTPTPLYCYENTFDVEHQSYKNTTRAIIKVTLAADTQAYYAVNGGITDEDGAKAAIEAYIIGNTEVDNAVKTGLNENQSYTIGENTFDITYSDDVAQGQYEVKSLKIKDTEISGNSGFAPNAKDKINDALAKLIDDINNDFVVFKYNGKEMYYEARFKHFAGDDTYADLAPWNNGEYGEKKPEGGSTDNAYPLGKDSKTAEENYLGRYGMVRNNWYEVEITAFTGLGYPEFPSVTVETPGYDKPDTPDDNLKDNIAVKIHVLSWAKRNQKWGF